MGLIAIRRLGLVEYVPTWDAMRELTRTRAPDTADELWLVEHPPVYTLGHASRDAHLPRTPSTIPIVRTDRGGQITYHGPGQVVVYALVNLDRRGISIRTFVRLLERCVIDLLAEHGVSANGRTDAPGVYVDGAKIAALGLRVRRGCCYHGLALNVDMDLAPFLNIDPCGYPGMTVTSTARLGINSSSEAIGARLIEILRHSLEVQG